MVARADAIVRGTALSSYSQLDDSGGIVTVTVFRPIEVIKGTPQETLTIVEPGGEYDGRFMHIPGVPRFDEGREVLLFLSRTGPERWAVTDLVLGKFTFHAPSLAARGLLLRDSDEIHGWDSNLAPHRERARDAARFLEYVRAVSHGQRATDDYFTPDSQATASPTTQSTTPYGAAMTSSDASGATASALTSNAVYTATSYTMFINGSQGSRWNVFPNPVSFYSGTTQEPGAPGGGSTAITAAFNAWNNDCLSNVNYVYAGTDNGTHSQGLHAADGANTILFERDLSAWGVSPFTCSSNSYSGTLGLGGITTASGTHVLNGETFLTTQEADVEMNKGIANCTLLFNNGDFNSAVTHEVGHTLSFRHSDQDRGSSGACTSDPSLECSTTAIMKSFVSTGLNAALQAWDQHAVQAVYPGNVCAPSTPPPPPTCNVPIITSQPQGATITSGGNHTMSVTASGTNLTYQWYVGSPGTTTNPVSGATGSVLTAGPATTTTYWVRVSNSCGSVDSTAATVTVVSSSASLTKFYLTSPCRLLDTRNATGTYGGPALASGATRNVPVAGVCGIPTGVTSISVNVTAVSPSSTGYVTLFPGPAGSPLPLASTINYMPNRTIANNAIVRVGSDSINVFNSGPSAVHFIIDVNGYFK